MKNKSIIIIVLIIVLIVIVMGIGSIISQNERSETNDSGEENNFSNEGSQNQANNTNITEDQPEIVEENPLPEGAEPFQSNLNVLDTAEDITELESFVTALKSTNLSGTLSSQQSDSLYTLFIPADFAFVEIEETVNSLSTEELFNVLSLHIAEGNTLSADFEEGLIFETLSGQNLELVRGEEGFLILQGPTNSADIITIDLVSSNGVIHIIDSVLLP